MHGNIVWVMHFSPTIKIKASCLKKQLQLLKANKELKCKLVHIPLSCTLFYNLLQGITLHIPYVNYPSKEKGAVKQL